MRPDALNACSAIADDPSNGRGLRRLANVPQKTPAADHDRYVPRYDMAMARFG